MTTAQRPTKVPRPVTHLLCDAPCPNRIAPDQQVVVSTLPPEANPSDERELKQLTTPQRFSRFNREWEHRGLPRSRGR